MTLDRPAVRRPLPAVPEDVLIPRGWLRKVTARCSTEQLVELLACLASFGPIQIVDRVSLDSDHLGEPSAELAVTPLALEVAEDRTSHAQLAAREAAKRATSKAFREG